MKARIFPARRIRIVLLASVLLLSMTMLVVPRPARAGASQATTAPSARVDTDVPPAVTRSGPITAAAVPAPAAAPAPARVGIEPFTMIGLSWVGPARDARFRVHGPGGWGQWEAIEADEDDGPDSTSPEAGNTRAITRPVWVDKSDGYEVEIPGSDARVHLVRENAAAPVRLQAASVQASAAGGQPPIVGRDSWGAAPPRAPIAVASRLKMSFVHHTVGSNTYSASQVPSILRSIQAYHMGTNGWDDIGYNFLVDRFGGIWEGRAGGIDRAVIGAHSAGFNTGATGVAVLGNFVNTAPSGAAVDAVSRLLAWKLSLHGVNPYGSAVMTSGGSGKYPAGTTVTLNAISGHQDAQATECPGRFLYERLGEIRQRASALAGSAPILSPLGWHLRSANSSGIGDAGSFYYGDNTDTPLSCDWDGNATSTPGVRRDAWFFLRNSNTSGVGEVNFIFGDPGDVPICGDWNGDGVDTVGLKRGAYWFLNNQNDSSPPEYILHYGDPGDVPVVGDWDADPSRTDTIGVFRSGLWFLKNRNDASHADLGFFYGDRGDRPITGNWSGSAGAPDSVGVSRVGYWFLNANPDSSPPEYGFMYGDAGDRPMTNDWDGNGSFTPGIVRY